MFDRYDLNILMRLQEQGRITNQDLAASINLSPAACLRRVKLLESRGLIARYSAILDQKSLGLEMKVLVEISLSSQHATTFDSFEAQVKVHPEILECYLMSGGADYLLKIAARDTQDYERIHRTILSSLPGVTKIHSNFAIRTICERTALPLDLAMMRR